MKWVGGLVSLLSVAVFGFIVGIASTQDRVKAAVPPPPCAVEAPAPTDVWIDRGLDACITKCGTSIPFDVEVEPARIRCVCGRPPRLTVDRNVAR